MDEGCFSVSAASLYERLGGPAAPPLIDVRRTPTFDADPWMIVGAIRRPPDTVAEWGAALPKGRPIVVYCAHGLEIGCDTAARLRRIGLDARFLEGGIAEWAERKLPARRKREGSSRWVTRERPKIDRIACPWLIRRFIDPEASFLFVPTERVFDVARVTVATAYDIPGAEPFSHDGELFSFDAFLKVYGIEDAALNILAVIVRGTDTACPELAPQAAGLLALSLGLSANFASDHEMLEHGLVMYDALYTWCPQLPGREAQLDARGSLKTRKSIETDLTANGATRPLPPHGVSFGEALRVWLRVAALSFGGPAGQIAVMHRIIVDEKHWVGEPRFLHALSYCMLLPGPEAQQLATYIGWLMHRWPGAIVAGGLFVVPGIIAIMALSLIHAAFGQVPIVAASFFGLKAAVLAIVLHAVYRVGSRALKSGAMIALAALAFVAIFLGHLPFPLIVLMAGMIGFVGARAGSAVFVVGDGHGPSRVDAAGESRLGDDLPEHARLTVGRALRVSAIWLVLWLGPVVAIVMTLGASHTFAEIGGFFSKMAIVTFGGAYAVLAYMAQQAVETYGWLRPGEMLDGLGMAETTPGPLIMVVQFVGFMAAYRDPGSLPPLLAGTLGGLLATWTTFVPCFLWIGLGAPFIERLRDNKPLSGALAGITAAVVGVILNLAIWFALHTIFRETIHVRDFGLAFDMPVLASVNPWAFVLSLAAMVAIFRFKTGTIHTLAACSTAGIVLHLAGFVTP